MTNHDNTRMPGVMDCHAHIVPHPNHDHGFRLQRIWQRCERYEVKGMVYSMYCDEGKPEIDLDYLQSMAQPYHIEVRVSLGSEPPSRIDEEASWNRRYEMAEAAIRKWVKHKLVVGIGEIGLDYHWPLINFLKTRDGAKYSKRRKSSRGQEMGDIEEIKDKYHEELKREPIVDRCLQTQKRLLTQWTKVAMELDVPMVLHIREAEEDALQILNGSGIKPQQVMFHCFAGTPEMARKCAQLGYWISIPSSVAYRNKFREIAKVSDLQHVLLETDSPYHAPFQFFWDQFRRQCRAEGEQKGLQFAQLQSWLEEKVTHRFNRRINHDFPELEFEIQEEKSISTISASQYFLKPRHRVTNESTFVRYAAISIAEIKNCDMQEVCDTTTTNARQFFRLV